VSVASWWELSIKQSRGVTALPVTCAEVRDAALQAGLREMPVLGTHAVRVSELPQLHRDPFDRMLIAQALCEPMRLITADGLVASYASVCGVLNDRVGV
jgi:PIN domain nuclease of toxin-antitoxin system